MTPKTFAIRQLTDARHRASKGKNFILLCASVSLWLLAVFPASAATHVTATYDIGQNPRVMATVNGQPQYGLVFAQRNKLVTYNSVEYGITVIYGYLDVNGALNDGSENLYLDLIPNLGSTPADGYYVVTFNIQGQVHAEIWVVPDQATVTAEVCRQAQPPSSTAPALFYQFLQEDGNALPQRQKLNLTGAGVSCLDNAGQLRTDCTFSGGGGSAPIASATVSGTVKTDQTVADPVVYLTTSTDSLLAAKVPTSRSVNTTTPLSGGGALSSDLTLSCPTCEITGNKNAASGYAGLDGSSKISGSQISEVLSSADLTDFADKSGTGTTIIGATVTTPGANQALTWNGSNWVNQAQLVTSVFSRTGAVAAQSGDYSAALVTNAADKTAENIFTAAGGITLDNELAFRLREATANGTDYFALKAPTSITTPFTLTWAATGQCTGSNSGKLTINASSEIVCGDDISGGAGGGYDAVAADSGTASKTSTESLKFAGTANEISTVVTTDDTTQDVLTWSLPVQLNLSGKEIVGGATPLKFEGTTDDNVYVTLTVTDPTLARTFTLPNADSVAVQPDSGAANNFLTAISTLGVISKSQPDFSNLSGTASDGQIPAAITRDSEVNVQGTANEITSSGSGVTPTLSLASQLNISGKEIIGGATPLKFEGTTDDNIYTLFSITDPTTSSKTFTLPDANTVATQSYTCTNQFATALSGATGATTCSTATLASAQFANQGTTTTLLHGNAAGNPSFGAVSLTADVSGILPGANGGTNNGFMAFTGPATPLKTFTLPNASATILTTNAAVTSAQGGTGANNTATTGRFLRGNGTDFVTSTGAAGGAGSCTNQVVTATNDDAAPTCANVSSVMISDGVVASADLATANKTITKSIDIFDPTTSDTNKIQFYWPAAVTLQRVACSVDTGTVTIQLDERAEATPNTAGVDAMTAALVCSTTTGTTTSFSDTVHAVDVPINLQITATSGTPTIVRIHVKAQIN